jgi:hypothetical protein
MRKSSLCTYLSGKPIMEAERSNTIRNTLADLTERVAELRRYL